MATESQGSSYKVDALIAEDIDAYLIQHQHKSLLRFITCGSVDDGKSTLIGRMLYDSKMIFEDQLAQLESDINDSKMKKLPASCRVPHILTRGIRRDDIWRTNGRRPARRHPALLPIEAEHDDVDAGTDAQERHAIAAAQMAALGGDGGGDGQGGAAGVAEVFDRREVAVQVQP